MTALELNAELFRQLSIIAEDETLMRKAVEAIRRLAQQKEAQTEETEPNTDSFFCLANATTVTSSRAIPLSSFMVTTRKAFRFLGLNSMIFFSNPI